MIKFKLLLRPHNWFYFFAPWYAMTKVSKPFSTRLLAWYIIRGLRPKSPRTRMATERCTGRCRLRCHPKTTRTSIAIDRNSIAVWAAYKKRTRRRLISHFTLHPRSNCLSYSLFERKTAGEIVTLYLSQCSRTVLWN